MSLWSISAAKKRDDEVPGTSKWIRKELRTLHELMISNTEQFAYSVASEFTWIDEQMEEIFNATEENPRLLLESPSKLRGENSPTKKLRDQAVQLMSPHKSASKSPMRELDINALRLSPIRFEKQSTKPSSPVIKSSLHINSPVRVIPASKPTETETQTQTQPQPQPQLQPQLDLPVKKSYNPFLEAPKPTHAPLKLVSPTKPEAVTASHVVQAPRIYSPDEHHAPVKDSEVNKLVADPEEDQDNYDASLDDNSFQAIRTKIRKSLAKRTGTERPNTTGENSYKSADDESRPSSLAAHPGSFPSLNATQRNPDSSGTIKVPLNDETSNKKKSTASNTPPPSKRESQGFALLPPRDPLTVKSAKKTESKSRLSLFDDDFNISPSKEEKSTSPPALKKSLYPSLSVDYTNPSTATSIPSPSIKSTASSATSKAAKKIPSPTKLKEPSLVPLKAKLASPQRSDIPSNKTNSSKSPSKPNSPSKPKSPTKAASPQKAVQSPISNLFASVNSTLKKARSKFMKETGKILTEGTDYKDLAPLSPSKTGPTTKENAHSVISHTTATTKSAEEIVSAPDQKTDDYEMEDDDPNADDDDNLKRLSMKFSPVKSAYGVLRREMNESPVKTDAAEAKEKSSTEVKKPQQPRNLTRMSLAKPEDNQHTRKSRGNGLASMPLEAKNKPSRPKSLVGQQSVVPVKRKSQTDEENRVLNRPSTNQAYRKIGSKIVAPSVSQSKQAQQDAKRRRTAEQLQSVLQKRASRVSQTQSQLPQGQEHEIPRPVKQTSKYTGTTNQTLMKTAVLQHARLNNDGKMANPFQSGGSSSFQSNAGFSKSNPPVTPAASTLPLPEIFSESDDDEEGSVLKDWANSPELKNILLNQQHVDPDKVFGPIAPLQMDEIFHSSHNVARLRNRGSSAQWTRDGLTTQEVESYKKRTYKR